MLKPRLARVLRTGSTALCLFALASLAPHLALAQVSVGDGGTPNFSQAIQVPPGVAGMSPKLSLLYAGGGVNGPLGHGWSVQGLSAITRCAATLAQDGKRVGVTYAATDKLCLDGQRLIQTDETGNAAPSGGNNAVGIAVTTQVNDAQGLGSSLYREFRTEKDMYARVRAYGYANGDTTGASGPAYFKVWTKAGQIYEYGQSPSSSSTTAALIAAPGKAPMAWAVARISDTLGNYIDFKYEQRDPAWGSGPTVGSPTTGHEWNILEIQYSGNKVVFNYEVDAYGNDVRTDKAEAYQQGSKNISARRLKSITTYVNSPATGLGVNGGTPVRTTKLSYEYGPISGRSRIFKIQDCAGGSSSTRCLPSTTLTYAAGGNEAYQANATFTAGSLATLDLIGNGTTGVLLGDFDGDGKTDILYWSDTPGNNKLYTSNGDGGFALNANFNLTSANLFKSDGCYYAIAADFNGDGVTDVLRIMRPTASAGNTSCGTVTNLLYLGSANGSFTTITLPSSVDLTQKTSASKDYFNCKQPKSNNYLVNCTEPGDILLGTSRTLGANFHLMDVNGDGILDIVTTVLPSYSKTASPPSESTQCASIVCTHVYLGSSSGTFSEATTTNLAHHSVYGDPPARYEFFRKPFVADFNGDGLQDLLVATGMWISNGDGNFSFVANSSYSLACANTIDFNGDGRSDCINTSGSAPNQNLTIGDGTFNYTATANFNLKSPGQELSDITYNDSIGSYTQSVGMIAIDFNGDGRQDILRWKDDASQNVIYLSNGDGTFTQSASFNLAGTQLQKGDGTSTLLLGDFTGRGGAELLRLQTVNGTVTNRLFVKSDSTPPDQLVSVTGASGLKSSLYYVPLSNSTPANGVSDSNLGARYQSDLGKPSFAITDASDLSMPMYVVATQVDDTGVGGGTNATELSYRGLKADLKGRGLLGFREVLRQRPGAEGSPLTVDTQYLQAYPYIGVAANSATYRSKLNATSASTLLSSTSNNYCDQTNPGAASSSVRYCPVTAKIARPYLFMSTESGQDLAGFALPTVITQNTFNGSGDPTDIVVTTTGAAAGVSQTFSKSVSNVYFADAITCSDYQTCSWILGRLNRSTVTNTVPNSLSSLATSAGSSAYASATAGTGPAVNSPLKFVLSNCTSTTPTLSPTPATYSCQLGNSGTSNASNLDYTTSANALVSSGPTTCAANTSNCGTVTMRTPATAGVYTGKFTVASAGATAGSANVTLTVTAPNGLGVSSTSFSPTSVAAGSSSSFSWSTTGAASANVACTGTGVSVTGAASGTAGNITVNTTAATTSANCTVTATAASGAMVSGSADLEVTSAGAASVSVASFNPTSVSSGGSSVFTWDTVNAASAGVACTGAGATATGAGTSGSISVGTSSAGSAICTVTALDSQGIETTGSATLTVNGADLPSITASDFGAANVTTGGTTTFTWSVSNATSSSASCAGAVGGSGAGTATGGSLTVTAGGTQGQGTCTVTASGAGGSVNTSKTVTVVLPPSTSGATFSPATVTSGDSSQLCWNSANTTRTTVSCTSHYVYSWDGAQNGQVCSPSSTLTSGTGAGSCTLTSYNAAGSTTTTSANISVVAAPSVSSATFSPSSVTAGSASTFSWATSNATSASVSCSGAGATATGSGTNGSISVGTSSAGTATCKVTALNAAGKTAEQNVDLLVSASQGTFSYVSSSHTSPGASGDTVTFNIKNVGVGSLTNIAISSCTGGSFHPQGSGPTSLAAGATGQWQCQAAASGSTGGATLTLTATNASNSPFVASESSSPASVVNASFSPTTVTTGGTSTLSWTTSNTTSVSVVCNGAASGNYSGTSVNGSLTVNAVNSGPGSCAVTSYNSVGAAGTSKTASLTVVLAPSVDSAAFSPTTVTAGGSSAFSWSTSNATSASVNCSGAGATATGNGTNGSINVATSSAGQASCTVSALNAAGTPASKSASLTVTSPTAPSITASDFGAANVTAGGTTTFTWSVSNATSSSASCAGAVGGSGAGTATGGSFTVTAGGTQGQGTCTVTASGAGGSVNTSKTVTVVLPPSTSGATFSPATVTSGDSSQLCWNSANTTRTTVSCTSHYVYSWDGAQNGQVCSPSSTLTSGTGAGSCTLTSYNAAGSTATTSANISVVAAPSVSSATFSPSSVTAGSASTFSWATSNATSASVSCSGAGATATGSGTNGSIGVGTSSAGTTTCKVTALNAAGKTAVRNTDLAVTAANAVVFGVTGPSGSTWTFSNPNSTAQAITGLSLEFGTSGDPMGAWISGGTCSAGGTVNAGATCTVIVNAPLPECAPHNYAVAPRLSTAAGAVTGNFLIRNAPAGIECY